MSKRYVFVAVLVLAVANCMPDLVMARSLVPYAKMKQANVLLPVDVNDAPPAATMSDELDKLFGNSGCQLPDKVVKDLKDKHKLGVVPDELQKMLGPDLSAKAQQISHLTAMGTLLQIQITMPNSQPKFLRLVGSDSYSNGDPIAYIDTSASNVAFTMDCAGYLNAALAADTSLFAINAKAAAQSSLQSHVAFAVVSANVFSPVALAMDTGLGSILMLRSTHIDLLYAMEKEAKNAWPEIPDTTEITTWREVHMIWTSNQGGSSFQGSAQLSAAGGGSIPGASLQVSASSGGSLSRAISFAAFSTYIMSDAELELVHRPFGDLRADLMALVTSAQPTDISQEQNGGVYTVYATFKDIPKSICTRTWTAKADGAGASVSATHADFNNNGCRFTLNPSASLAGQTVRLTSPNDLKSTDVFALSLVVPR